MGHVGADIFFQRGAIGIVIRFIRTIIPPFEELKLPPVLLNLVMERRGMEARPHGFRSSLRDWLAEATDTPREIAETVLGHTVEAGELQGEGKSV